MLKNIEKVLCNRELAALVKLNLKTKIDGKIYGEEYNRIGNRIEKTKSKQSSVA